MSKIPQIINQDKVKLHRERAGRMSSDHGFLLREVSERMCERLDDIVCEYKSILNIGSGTSDMVNLFRNRKEVEVLVSQDCAESMLRNVGGIGVVADEEKMPFTNSSFDLVISNLSLHNVNDLPGSLIQIKRMLKSKGVFMASFYGAQTLKELRQVMAEVEMEEFGGVSPRILPFTDLKILGQLVQRTGFDQAVADNERIEVIYDGVSSLIYDLRGMGETNALKSYSRPLNRNFIRRVDEVFKEKFGDGEGGVISTFDIINITGLAAISV